MSATKNVSRLQKGTQAESEAWIKGVEARLHEVLSAGQDFVEAIKEDKRRGAKSALGAQPVTGNPLPAGAHIDPGTRRFNMALSSRLQEYVSTAESHIRELETFLEELEENRHRYRFSPWAEQRRRQAVRDTEKRLSDARDGLRYLRTHSRDILDDLHAEGIDPITEGPDDRRPRPTATIDPYRQPIHPVLWGPGYRPRDSPDPLYRYGPRRPGHDPGDPDRPGFESMGERIARRHRERTDPRPMAPRAPYFEDPGVPSRLPPSGHWNPHPRGKGMMRYLGEYIPPQEGREGVREGVREAVREGGAAQGIGRPQIAQIIREYLRARGYDPDDRLFTDYINANMELIKTRIERQLRTENPNDPRKYIEDDLEVIKDFYDSNVRALEELPEESGVGSMGEGAGNASQRQLRQQARTEILDLLNNIAIRGTVPNMDAYVNANFDTIVTNVMARLGREQTMSVKKAAEEEFDAILDMLEDQKARRDAVRDEILHILDNLEPVEKPDKLVNYVNNRIETIIDDVIKLMDNNEGMTVEQAAGRGFGKVVTLVDDLDDDDPSFDTLQAAAGLGIEEALDGLKVVSAQLGLDVGEQHMMVVGAPSRRALRGVASMKNVREDHHRRLNRVMGHLKKLEGLRLRILSNESEFQKRLAISKKQLRDIAAHIKASEKEAAMLQQRIREIGGAFPAEGAAFGTSDLSDLWVAAGDSIEMSVAEDRALAAAMTDDWTGEGRGSGPMEALVGGEYDDSDEAEDEDSYYGGGEYDNELGGEGAMPAEGIVSWFKKKRGKRRARQGLGDVADVHKDEMRQKRKEKQQIRRQTKQRTGAISKDIRALRRKRSKESKKGRKQSRAVAKEERELRKRERNARRLRRSVAAAGSSLSDHLVSIGAAFESGAKREGGQDYDIDDVSAEGHSEIVEAKVDHHATHAMAHLFGVLDTEVNEEGEESEEGAGSEGAMAAGADLSPVTKYIHAWVNAARTRVGGRLGDGSYDDEDDEDELERHAKSIEGELGGEGGASEELVSAWNALHQRNRQLLDDMGRGDEEEI